MRSEGEREGYKIIKRDKNIPKWERGIRVRWGIRGKNGNFINS